MNKNLLLWAFAISGMTALIYEIVWSRSLEVIFGSTIYAVSTILTTFFVGFSLGAYFFRNLADKTKNPLALFGILELAIGLYGLIVLSLFKILPSIYLSLNTSNLQFVQFILLFAVLIVPTTLFGAIWPVINKAYIKEEIGKDAGILYSFNSLGSFIGSIGAGFLLLPLLGIRNTSILISVLNILIGISMLILSKGGGNGTE